MVDGVERVVFNPVLSLFTLELSDLSDFNSRRAGSTTGRVAALSEKKRELTVTIGSHPPLSPL